LRAVTADGLRLRQAVLAAAELQPVVGRLREELGLGEPFADPGVDAFGLENAVFAIGDCFLEVVSPVRPDTAAGRWLERRGGDCGYMLMFQLDDVDAARERAHSLGVRDVLALDLDDISESHLHPADMRGAIVSISEPKPPQAWRWGGPDWQGRSAPGALAGAEVAVRDPASVGERWEGVLGAKPASAGVELRADPNEPGLTAIRLAGIGTREPLEVGGVRFEFEGGR
jgi:hypothetical protein